MWLMTPSGFFSVVKKPGGRQAGLLRQPCRCIIARTAFRSHQSCKLFPDGQTTHNGATTSTRGNPEVFNTSYRRSTGKFPRHV